MERRLAAILAADVVGWGPDLLVAARCAAVFGQSSGMIQVVTD